MRRVAAGATARGCHIRLSGAPLPEYRQVRKSSCKIFTRAGGPLAERCPGTLSRRRDTKLPGGLGFFPTAASLQVTVPEKRDLFGWPTWHFRAALHTQIPVRSLFTIDDQFDSYADTHTLDTRRYETYQNELGARQIASSSS